MMLKMQLCHQQGGVYNQKTSSTFSRNISKAKMPVLGNLPSSRVPSTIKNTWISSSASSRLLVNCRQVCQSLATTEVWEGRSPGAEIINHVFSMPPFLSSSSLFNCPLLSFPLTRRQTSTCSLSWVLGNLIGIYTSVLDWTFCTVWPATWQPDHYENSTNLLIDVLVKLGSIWLILLNFTFNWLVFIIHKFGLEINLFSKEALNWSKMSVKHL